MKAIGPVLLAASLVASGAFAAERSIAPLTPGKPAGVQKAQAQTQTLLWVLGGGLVIGGIALVAGNGGGQTPAGSTSSSTSTTVP